MENTKKFKNDEMGLKFARLSVIAFGEKIRDDRLDNNDMRSRVLSFVYKKLLLDAKENEPESYRISYEGTTRINELQDANAPLEEIFAAYGNMAADSFATIAKIDDAHLALIRALAEWTFFVDMVCDYADDYRSGSYNGFRTEGFATFPEYFDAHYNEFAAVEEKISGKLVSAVFAIKDNSTLWYIIHKIIVSAVSTVIPSLIKGEDVTYHYIRELIGQCKTMKQEQRLIRESKKEQEKYFPERENS